MTGDRSTRSSIRRRWSGTLATGEDGAEPTDEALQRVRDKFEAAVEEAEEMSGKARREVEDAIDDLEQRIDELRDRE